VALNAGCKCATVAAFSLLAKSLDKVSEAWSLALIHERDAKLAHMSDEEIEILCPNACWSVQRHWAGPGSYVQLLILRKTFLPYVRQTEWRGRCVAILFSHKPIEQQEMKLKLTATRCF
jgi:hypothetical protein